MTDAAPILPTFLVTGASQGIGWAVARGLVALGPCEVVLVARRPSLLESRVRELVGSAPGVKACAHAIDLSLQSEIRSNVPRILEDHPRIDAVVQNAGAMYTVRRETREGVERTFALNVLAPVFLSELLRPALRAASPSRLVMVASEAHRGAHLDLNDLELRRGYRGFKAYGRSKLALIELTRVMAERYRADGIDVNALHPGFIASGFGQNNGTLSRWFFRVVEAAFGRSPEYGARTPVFLARSPVVRGTTGQYFVRNRTARPSRAARTAGEAEALWEWCVRRVGTTAAP